jgi:hypothetical protein
VALGSPFSSSLPTSPDQKSFPNLLKEIFFSIPLGPSTTQHSGFSRQIPDEFNKFQGYPTCALCTVESFWPCSNIADGSTSAVGLIEEQGYHLY